jgi:hypothetical protein
MHAKRVILKVDMAKTKSEKIYHVDFDGRATVDVNALLRDPKVKATIERMSKRNERFRGKPGVTFVMPIRQQRDS